MFGDRRRSDSSSIHINRFPKRTSFSIDPPQTPLTKKNKKSQSDPQVLRKARSTSPPKAEKYHLKKRRAKSLSLARDNANDVVEDKQVRSEGGIDLKAPTSDPRVSNRSNENPKSVTESESQSRSEQPRGRARSRSRSGSSQSSSSQSRSRSTSTGSRTTTTGSRTTSHSQSGSQEGDIEMGKIPRASYPASETRNSSQSDTSKQTRKRKGSKPGRNQTRRSKTSSSSSRDNTFMVHEEHSGSGSESTKVAKPLDDDENVWYQPRPLRYNLQGQARELLTDDFPWFFIGVLIVFLSEQDLFDNGDFSIFNFLFELTSAFGNNGMSFGIFRRNTALSTAFSAFGKFCVVAIMLVGRHRNVPSSRVDNSIKLPVLQERDDRDQRRTGMELTREQPDEWRVEKTKEQ